MASPVKGFDSQEFLKKLYEKGQSFYTRVVVSYCFLATVILMIPININTFRNWNGDFHLHIGNEATLNRPWKGIVYKLSIFNQKFFKMKCVIFIFDHTGGKYIRVNTTPPLLSSE